MRSGLALRRALGGAILGASAVLLGILVSPRDPSPAVSALSALVGAAVVGVTAFLMVRNVVDIAAAAAANVVAEELERGPAGSAREAADFGPLVRRLHQLLESVAAERARNEAVFEAGTDGLVAVDSQARTRYLNHAALHLFGASREQAIGRPFIEVSRDYELDVLLRGAIADRAPRESASVTFGPARLPLRVVALPITGGGDWSALLVLADLTEVRRVDQVRRDFLTNVSHELRTPLAAIRALVETMEQGHVEAADAPEFLRRIGQQVGKMTGLVDELLDLSRIESGAMALTPESIDLSAAAREAASLLGVRAETARVTIEVPPGVGPEVAADRPAVARIVGNLLDNAIKFSPPGGVVRVDFRQDDGAATILVSDLGPGIPRPDLDRVFERFYKGDSARSTDGVGLGLAIVKHLVRLHGGTVEVESPPGEGSRFLVRLPKVFMDALRRRTGGRLSGGGLAPKSRRSWLKYEHIVVEGDGDFAVITMNRPERRNALSVAHMLELQGAFTEVGRTEALGVVLAANGPVFSAGHDFADMAGADLLTMRELLGTCTRLMETIQAIPQVVIARVQGLATAAGCQLVATCDLAVAATSAGFAAPGGKGGWFCHTPLVAISRNISRKHALEMALTGDPISAETAAAWGLINRAVASEDLDSATWDLLTRATRGSRASKSLGKHGFYAQVDLDQAKAYAYAVELMAAASQTEDAQEGMRSFLEKRTPEWKGR